VNAGSDWGPGASVLHGRGRARPPVRRAVLDPSAPKGRDESVYQFKVKTSYARGGAEDAPRLDWLYEEFSRRVAEKKLVALRDEKK